MDLCHSPVYALWEKVGNKWVIPWMKQGGAHAKIGKKQLIIDKKKF